MLNLLTEEITRLGLAGVGPQYVSTGHLVYAAEDLSVRAVPFDTTTLEVKGNPVPLIEGVRVKTSGAADRSISGDGRLVYASGTGDGPRRSFVWVNKAGQEEPVAADPAGYREFNLSPDGTRVAVNIGGDDSAVWIYDLVRNTTTRLTFQSGVTSRFPTWTPDSTLVAFGPPLSWKRADGTGEVERLTDESGRRPLAFSPDGMTLVFEDRGGNSTGLGMLAWEDGASTVLLDEESTGPWRQRTPRHFGLE